MICKACGENEVNLRVGSAERYPYCRNCHYTGIAAEHQREDQLRVIQAKLEAEFPGAKVGVDHTGGGCFQLYVRWDDHPVSYVATDGSASLPADPHIGTRPILNGWGIVAAERKDGDLDDWREVRSAEIGSDAYWVEYPRLAFSDDQLVEAIIEDRKRGDDDA